MEPSIVQNQICMDQFVVLSVTMVIMLKDLNMLLVYLREFGKRLMEIYPLV